MNNEELLTAILEELKRMNSRIDKLEGIPTQLNRMESDLKSINTNIVLK